MFRRLKAFIRIHILQSKSSALLLDDAAFLGTANRTFDISLFLSSLLVKKSGHGL